MIISDEDYDDSETLKHELAHFFPIKDMGLLCYFLEIEVAQSQKG